jgi:hypothetical protein
LANALSAGQGPLESDPDDGVHANSAIGLDKLKFNSLMFEEEEENRGNAEDNPAHPTTIKSIAVDFIVNLLWRILVIYEE